MSRKLDPATINAVAPVVGIRVLKGGSVLVERKSLVQGSHVRGDRKKIRVFSKSSRERLALTAQECGIEFRTMITLTYGVNFPIDGKVVKESFASWLKRMRRHFGKFDYLWFLEFQRRGAPHFHVMTDLEYPTLWDRKTMASIWVDCIGAQHWRYSNVKTQRVNFEDIAVYDVHCHPKAWEELRSKGGAARYALKYALKMEQKVVPENYSNVGRLWGTSSPVKDAKYKLMPMDERCVRTLLSIHCPRMNDWEVLPSVIFGVFDFDPLRKRITDDGRISYPEE